MGVGIGQYVLKAHSRCDLACDHCYVYEHADQSWRAKPLALSRPTAARAADRIAEHAAAHRLERVSVVLHGGEPLLLGHAAMAGVLEELRARIAPVTGLDLGLHTNAVRLDERFCELFTEYGVRVGVSLDGDRRANDLHRTFANGRSSHEQVLRGLALLRRHPALYGGILCTIDQSTDPDAVYEALLAEAPPMIDLLLPHATWDLPPPRRPGVPTPYAHWLGRFHDRWTADGRPVPVRLFDSIRSAASGGPSWTEAIGTDEVGLLVIDTDGGWEQTDSLKIAYEGAPATGKNVFTHSVDEVTGHPGVQARRTGMAGLSQVCRACPVGTICGGGLYPHRYRTGSGFDNPSVYCDDLKSLILRIVPRQAGYHRLSRTSFAALASGSGDPQAIRALAESRVSLHRSLVAEAAERIQQAGEGQDAWKLLCAADEQRPEAVRELFAHPFVGVWAIRCLGPSATGADRSYLANLALAAAMRAGLSAELSLLVRDGQLHLPTLGSLHVDTDGNLPVSLTAEGKVETPGGRWLPLRRAISAGLSVTLDDLDPYRDVLDPEVSGRLSRVELRAWQSGLDAAGRELHRLLPGHAALLAEGLTSVVPLLPGRPGTERSAASQHAFGAVAIAFTSDADKLAELLVHEFQHVKLDGLQTLYELCRPDDGELAAVPWRPDPRPLEGVLHGTYAFLAVAELWRRRDPASAKFEHYRAWVGEGLAVLSRSDGLTELGARFVAGMSGTWRGW